MCGKTLTTTDTHSQRTWVLLCEVRQVDIGKVNEQHPYGLFGGVQKPERGGGICEREGDLVRTHLQHVTPLRKVNGL